MPLDSIVRKAVAIADKVTASLQPVITISAWIGQSSDGRGGQTFALPVSVHVIVEYGGKIIDTQGREIQTFAHLTFPRPLTPNGSPGRQEPIDPRDKITLMSGQTNPIVKIEGFADPSISRPFMTEVWLGK
jgi:hypothetical protein